MSRFVLVGKFPADLDDMDLHIFLTSITVDSVAENIEIQLTGENDKMFKIALTHEQALSLAAYLTEAAQ